MKTINSIDVFINERHVSTLALTDHRAAFQYDDEWIDTGYSLSPFSLPLDRQLYIPEYEPFEGLFGVFSDTLPDGWGRLIVDRYIRKKIKMEPNEVDGFHRLLLVSDMGMGALSYKPSYNIDDSGYIGDYDVIAEECRDLLNEETLNPSDPYSQDINSDVLDRLFKYGGSSGGARPKVMASIEGESWIVKFPSTYDPINIGVQEYEYSLCAKACGIDMPDTRLMPSKICNGYFGVKRFDRTGKADSKVKIHMVSAGGLLETSHRFPNLDYHQLMKLTLLLTEDMQQVNEMFDIMCFNIYAHNRDDHSKNFSYLYDESENRWKLSPAYDLTYSTSLGGEHATTVNGEGRSPSIKDILEVAKRAGINQRHAKQRAEEIEEIIKNMLKEYIG